MDLITYIPDLTAFRLEAASVIASKATDEPHLAASLVDADENGNLLFNTSKIPTIYNGNKSLCLVRIKSKAPLEALNTLEIIGECLAGEYLFYKDGQTKYEAAYDTSSRMIDDGNGGQVEYTPPYKIGVFS